MDFPTLVRLRRHHAGWRLLGADSAPFVASFLYATFIRTNARSISQDDLTARLEDALHEVREVHGAHHPRTAQQYLEEWSGAEAAWLRKYYPPGSDEPEFDLTPTAEKALEWLASLAQPAFVGTESRLLTIVQLLRDLVSAADTSPEARIHELERRRAELDRELALVRAGGYTPFTATQVRERFLQVEDTARRLLSDFRQVEENFRLLDRATREQIAASTGTKGEVLDAVFGKQDSIATSDQGRSFQAFWSFIMAPERQEELTALVQRAVQLDEVSNLAADDLLPRIQFHLLEAGDKVQRTRAALVEQLRRFLDERVWLENKRIVEILRRLEQAAVAVAQAPPPDKDFASLQAPQPSVALPFERSLALPTQRPRFDVQPVAAADEALPVEALEALFQQPYVDEAELRRHIQALLRERDQVTLAEVLKVRPPTHGLAEIVGYWHLACRERLAVVDESQRQCIVWGEGTAEKRVSLPLIIFVRVATERSA